MIVRRATYAAYARHAYYGWDYGWRFSAARSVQCATSDREMTGGMTTRCLPIPRS
ncbi:MAG: hypothetical protein LPK08_00040 [Halomonas sp.]|uniref:Uncharacterized protein n=2 Tax=Halomonadaceae TaxID=28256 RepID=A0ABS6ZKQ2_9GAMM|nr:MULTISPECIES: hypothetical protein [Halomonas]MBW6390495.1 hypothetical protein [Halomonas antri]MDX5375903.1 hypothetical protein [Halomonas sp.]QTP57698.1 hypothetical protein HNO53_02515 [Halomonas sulfidivorans]